MSAACAMVAFASGVYSACAPAQTASAKRAAPRSPPRLSRRALGCALIAAAVRLRMADAVLAAEPASPGLPGGAAEFSRVLAARERWAELGRAVERGDATDAEWTSARSFLRAFYSIGSDMRFLSKPWDRALRSRGDAAAKELEKTLKAMDVPAQNKDVAKFMELHKRADGLVELFFAVFSEASAGDMPAEL